MTEGIFCVKVDGHYVLSLVDRSVVTKVNDHILDKNDEEVGMERPVWYDLETGHFQFIRPR